MLNWPLNAPHRVENLGTVNISMRVSYGNDDIRRAQIVHLANGLLRHRFGYTPKTSNLRGPSFFAKKVLAFASEEGVATLLGIGSRCVMIRISNAGEKWSNCSPGRLIIERTMAALHRDGVRAFDFSVGNYAYKRRFGVTRLPLIDISAALSWRGGPTRCVITRCARAAISGSCVTRMIVLPSSCSFSKRCMISMLVFESRAPNTSMVERRCELPK